MKKFCLWSLGILLGGGLNSCQSEKYTQMKRFEEVSLTLFKENRRLEAQMKQLEAELEKKHSLTTQVVTLSSHSWLKKIFKKPTAAAIISSVKGRAFYAFGLSPLSPLN